MEVLALDRDFLETSLEGGKEQVRRLRPWAEQLLSRVPELILQGALAVKKLSWAEARAQPLWPREHAALGWDLTSHGAAHHSVPWGDSAHSTPDIWVNECFSAKGDSDPACMTFTTEHETEIQGKCMPRCNCTVHFSRCHHHRRRRCCFDVSL